MHGFMKVMSQLHQTISAHFLVENTSLDAITVGFSSYIFELKSSEWYVSCIMHRNTIIQYNQTILN